MKLRLHAGTLRLRLSRSEIAALRATGEVEEAVTFAPGKVLVYSIKTGPHPAVTAAFEDWAIRVLLPAELATHWMESNQTGIEASTGSLNLLIEKDFQCLHRPAEPGEDAFPNPLSPIAKL